MRICVLLLTLVAGCGDPEMPMMDLSMIVPDLSMSMDLSMPDLTINSSCGQPGDPGNAIGVGKFCVVQGDCPQGTFCTHPFSPGDYFCTVPCSSSGAPTQCGTGASCGCSTAGCGCVPTSCLGPMTG